MGLDIKLPGLDLKNPILPASGTFGFGEEFSKLYDLNILGGIVVKSVTLNERLGNKTPRVCETYGGMLNSIGLQNPGVDVFINEKIKFLEQYNIPIIVNVAGSSIEEYLEVVKKLNNIKNISCFELNISCPNVKEGGILFGSNKNLAYEITKKVRGVSLKPVYVKLSPNVTNIVEIAKSCEKAGSDGITMINTLMGMKIDLKKGRPFLNNKHGGLSGPCIKPIAIKMIYDVYENINIPIIGMGGISNSYDVLEFLYAGASAVCIGTMNFINPYICKNIIEELPNVLKEYGFNDIKEVIGYAHRQ